MLVLEFVAIIALILINGAFAMSELAVVSSRRSRLQSMAESGHAGARAALALIDSPSRFLSTVQIGITLVGVVAGAFGGATLGARFGGWLASFPVLGEIGEILGIGSVIIVITYLSIVLGELVPKRVALKSPERTASIVARPMQFLSRIASPFVWLLGTSTDGLLRLLGLYGERESTVTEDEVRSMISEGTRAGIFAPEEKKMIDGVLRLADRSVRTIMTPRPGVVWLDLDASADELLRIVRTGGHSRYPVCRGNLDELIGIMHVRDLLPESAEAKPLDVQARATKALVVHEATPVLKLLDLMKWSGQHLAIVVDEYGSVEGLATTTDILETVAGDLPEAGDESEPAAARRADGSWLIDGAMPVDEFEESVGLPGLRTGGDFHTVAGFVLHVLGHIPKTGESFLHADHQFEIVDMDGHRIDKILVTPPEAAVSDEEQM